MTEQKKAQLEAQARTLAEGVLAQTKELKDKHKCKVLADTIFMLQGQVNALKPTL